MSYEFPPTLLYQHLATAGVGVVTTTPLLVALASGGAYRIHSCWVAGNRGNTGLVEVHLRDALGNDFFAYTTAATAGGGGFGLAFPPPGIELAKAQGVNAVHSATVAAQGFDVFIAYYPDVY